MQKMSNGIDLIFLYSTESLLAIRETIEELVPSEFSNVIAIRSAPDAERDDLLLKKFKKVKFLIDPGVGPEAAINCGLEYVKSPFFTLIFAGDKVVFNDSISNLLENLSLDMLLYPKLIFEIKGRLIESKRANLWARRVVMPQINFIGGIIPTNAFRKVGGFPTSLKVANDHLLILKLNDFVKFVKTDKIVTTFRDGGISTRGFEIGLAETALNSGMLWAFFAVPVGLLKCIVRGGSPLKFLNFLVRKIA